jgi:GntR family transcriptional repressor for pyruvate dehydrogenase complex
MSFLDAFLGTSKESRLTSWQIGMTIKKIPMSTKVRSRPADAIERLASELGPVPFEGLTEHLIRHMRGWVLRGLIQPGERLPPERKLAAMLNVSRSSLRQALKVLQVMGVFEVKQGSGNYLSESSGGILRQPTDLLMPLRGLSFGELFEARRAMEAEAAACAALRASDAEVRKIGRELEQMRLRLSAPVFYFRHDVAFHRHIALASGNSIFVWFFELVSKVLSEAWLGRAKEGNSQRTFAEHQSIASAIERHDPEAARTAMLQHLMLTKFYSNQQTPFELRVVAK